jgi:flagellar operon protein
MNLLVELGRLNALNRSSGNGSSSPTKKPGTGFQDVLKSTLTQGSEFQISGHAEKRIFERSITMDGATKSVLNDSLNELAAKGARDSLIVTNQAAFVFNVPNRTMVTAMDLNEVKNRLVTNIDSVMIRST